MNGGEPDAEMHALPGHQTVNSEAGTSALVVSASANWQHYSFSRASAASGATGLGLPGDRHTSMYVRQLLMIKRVLLHRLSICRFPAFPILDIKLAVQDEAKPSPSRQPAQRLGLLLIGRVQQGVCAAHLGLQRAGLGLQA